MIGVENEYFGGDVSVAGLLTGGDFLAARKNVRGDFAIIPQVALKSDEPVMLDGMRFEELQSQLDVPLYALDFNGFAQMLIPVSERSARIPACGPQASLPALLA